MLRCRVSGKASERERDDERTGDADVMLCRI